MAKKTTSTAAKKKEQERLNQGGQNIANIAQNIVARRQEQAVNKTGQQYGIRRTAGDMMATRALGAIQDREMLSYRKRLEEEERRRREAEEARRQNVAGNLRSAAMRVNNGGMAGNPTQEKLRKSSLETIMDGLKAKIGNEQKIINEQGRAEDDPARIRAEKELKDLEKRMAGTQAKIASIPPAAAGSAVTTGISGYTPEEEAYIQRLQKKLERGQSRKQTIPAVWNQDLKAIQHMRNAPEKAEGDEYIRWLQEGGQIGLYDGKTTNALIAQAGRSDDPLAQYMALDDSQKSGWLRSAGKDLNSIISMRAAKEYNQAHPYATDRDELLEKQNYFTGLRDEAQGALDRMNGNIRIMYRPNDGEEYEIRGRSNPYYQQNPEAINEQFYDALVGPGEYRKRKAEFTDDQKGWEKADQLELQLTEAWDAYEQGRWNDAYRILTGKNNYAEMESQLGYANDQLNTIQGQLNLYDQYDAFMGGYTGAQRASYDPEKDRGFDSLVDYGTPEMPKTRPTYNDPNTKDVHRIYSFINLGKEYNAYIKNAAGGDENAAKIDGAYGKSALMLPEEIEIFNGYYNAGKYQEASAFFNGLSMALNDRYAKYEEIENREMARKYPVLSSFETLLAEQLSGALAIPRTFAGFAGEKAVTDPNSAWYASSRYTEQTQDEIANMIGGEGGKFYLQGMNTLRNLTNAAMVALAGVPASGQAAAGLAMFAAQIYQDQTYKYLKETNDYGKAAGLATLDAVLETMEEMLPYEVMLSGGGNIILDILANSTSEALEELTGATVGEAIKGLITGRQDWEKRKDQIFNEGGYTDDSGNWIALDTSDSNKALAEAQTQAWKEKGHEIIENTVAGFVGGSMGASYGQVRNYLNTRSIGAQVNSREGGFNTLLTAARGMEENSATRKLAEQLYAKQQKGKTISNYQTGQLAQTMYQESGQEIRDVIEGAMTRKVEGELKAEGASDEYAEEAAPIIAQAVTTGKTMRKADIKAIAKEDAGMVLMQSYLTGEKNAAESIRKAGGEAAMNANQAVRDVLGEKQAPVNMKKPKEELLKYAPIAKAEELEAATGTRHENGLDAVVDKQVVQVIGRKGDQYTILDENNNERTVNKNDVRAAGENLGLLMEYADRNRNIIDDDTFREIALGMKDNPEIDIDEYLNESARAVINYRTGGEVTNSRLAESTLNALKSTAKRLNDEWDQERTAKAGNQRKATPGKGIVTYKGIKAGTEEWENTAKKAGPLLGNQLRIIGEMGVRLGNEIEIVEREDMPDAFGWQDPETGKIYVNLAAENVKGIKNNRHVLTVTAHELTHWLEQNSPEEYKALRNFVFNSLRNSGMDIASRVMERIDNFRGVMGKEMTVNDALAEIVADACDQVLTNEQVAKQLEAESPNLYQKIKTFVKNFIETVRKYAGTIDTSKESRKMMQAGPDALDEMARIWLGARSEALNRQAGNQAEAKEENGQTVFSTREAEDQGIKDLEKALAHPHVKFSMREPIEATKDGLVAVHNMHLPELMGTLEEGGVTAPSIAVILARMGHSKYGNVSLVFKPSAIDPMKSRKNMVYGADAYTPERAHARVEQEIVTPEVKKAINVVKGLLEGMDGNFVHAVDNWFNQYLYDDDTYYSLTEIAKTGYTNIGMLAAYQKSKGNNVDPVFRDVPTSRAKTENEQDYGKLIDGLFDRGLYEQFFTDYDNAESHNGFSPVELREKYAGIFKDILKETNRRWEIIKLENPGMMEKIFTSNWFNEFYDYNKKGIGDVKKFDEYETRKALQEKTNEDDLTDWLAGVIRNTLGQKGIRNNKDTFTNIGNRRSFKALHDEYTTENVVKAMYKNAQQKGEGADYFQGLMATASKEYKNLKEVKADAGRLEIMDQEEYDAYIAQKSREMNELAEELSPSYPRVAREALLEAGKKYARNQTPEAVKRAFAAAGYNLTNEQLNKALDLIKEAREYKTGYFEAKPERVMDFDEIARVILPESVKDEQLYKPVLDMLDERGIPYDTYDGTDEDRLAKLNSVENVQFSTRELDNQYMQAVKNRDRATAQLMVDAQAIRSGFTTEDAFHGTPAFGFNRFDMEASGGAIFVAYSPKIAGTYVDNGEVRMIGKKYPEIGLDIMSAEQLAEELQEYYQNLPKSMGYETANEWTVKGIDKDDYVDFVLDYAENMKKLAAGKSFEKEVTRLVDKMVALAHTGDEKAAYQVGVDLQRKFRTADYFGQDELENRRLELSAMMIPALAKGEDVININMHGINYYLSRSDVIRQLEKYSQDQEGIYRFYTRPGNQLLIDAKGANWNKIWIEDEQLRNDIWTYFNQKEALEEAQGIKTYSKDMFTVTTRQISEYARYKKYSSVRINDVYDHGGRGDWDRERGHGDIAMFFNPNDVKSADQVTYDDAGNVIPLSERFNQEQQDIRYSTREMDSEGRQLSPQQQEFFKDSKAVDRQGRLKVLYHGAPRAGFDVFKNDDSTFWFTDSKDVALTYSNSIGEYAPEHGYEMDPEDRWLAEVNGENYVVYLNIKNPAILDAAGSSWKTVRNPFGTGTLNTDEWAKRAKDFGFDGVIIRNVVDEGDRYWRTIKGTVSTVYAVFSPEQIKSVNNTDPTNDQDIRFSTREADLEVNRWMLGLSESSLRTAQEQMLWKQYKEVNGSWELTKRFIRELNGRLKGLEAKENKTAKDIFDIQNLQKQIEKWEAKRDEYEEQLLKVTADGGYAAIMYRERNKMENLLNGRTEDEVRQTIDAIQAELDTAAREMAQRNERLKELAEKENVKRIRQQLNSAGLRRIAAKLKENLGSELQNKEIENRLALLALKMKQGKVDSTEIMELADMLVGSMRPAYDDYVLSELRGMTIGLNSSELETLKNRGMNIRDLQRELTGTGIRVVAGGQNTIDKNWEELTAALPNLDPAANPGDMLWGPDTDHKGLMDLVEDAIRQQRAAGPDSDQVAAMVLEAASDLVPEILTDAKSMQMIRETMEFIAEINQSTEALDNVNALFDRLKKKNAKAKATLGVLENKIIDAIEYTNELSKQHDVTAWKRERQALVERLRSEHTQKLLEEQTKYREKIERYKKAQDLNADNQAARREIHMNINRMRRLLVAETDSRNIPEHMKSLAREMVGMVLKSDQLNDRKITAIKPKDRADALRMIQAWNDRDGKFTLNDLAQIPDEEIQDVIENALADIEEGIESYTAPAGRDLIENLSNYKKALEQIQDAVEKITNIIEAEQTAVIDGQKRRVEHLAYGVVADLDKSKRKGEWTGFGSKALTAAQRSVIYGNTTPVYFIKNLRNRGMNVLWNGFESAENRKGLLAEAARKHMQALADKYHYASWDHEKKYDVILNGVKVQMKLENMMALYATWTREQQMGPEVSQHMEQGGVYIEDEQENKGAPHREHKTQRARRVKQADIDRIEETLTQEQKDYIRDVVEYLSKDMSELGNEASMAMYGIRKYNEKYYFPMKVWDGVKSARSDKGISGTTENRIAHKGWDKRRKHKARNALIIGKFTDTAVQHIDEMTSYVTFAPVIEGLNKVLNWQEEQLDEDKVTNRRNLRVMFQEAYGKEALRYLEDWMKDLQGGVTQDQRKTLRDRLISMFKKNAVAGSLSVTLQQPLSYIRAAMMIDPKYLAGALSPQYWKGSYQEMLDHSGVAVIKQMGKFDMNFGQSTRDWIAPKAKKSAYEKISDVLTAAPQAADTMTWTRMWSAVKMEQHAQHPEMDMKSDDFLDLVGKRFNEVMRRTQVYDSTLTKSSNMRSQALSMKLITSFMAEPTLSLNVLADAVMNAKQKGGKATLAKAGATYLLSAVLQAAVKGFMGAGRSPDEKKTAAENVLNKILYNLMSEANPASLIPGYSDLVEVLKNGELKDDAMGVLGKLKSIYTTAQNMLNPDKSKGPWRDVEDTLGQFIQLFSNVPLKNLMRDARAMYNWATGSKFAQRDTSGAVLRYQAEETLNNGDNLLGVINSWLGDAGYKSTSKAYYTRMYGAMTGGNQAEAEGIREYLELEKGQDSKKVQAGLRTAAREDDSKTPAEQSQWMIDNDLLDGTSSITTQYKKGEITREEAEKLYKAASPKMKDDDIFWKLDQMDYEKETGETETGYYYRLRDAITKNKADEIQAAVKTLLAHGITKEKIKDKLSDWKAEYTAGDSAKKIQIRDAITKAYKAAGYTADDANKTIERWNKEAKKAEPEKKDAKDTTGRWGRGNIDLNNRKVVENDDGTISTERSFSVNIDGKEVLLPTVIDGKIVSEEEAIRHYEQTGQYLGKFNTVKEAEEYAEKLHKRQDWYYNK